MLVDGTASWVLLEPGADALLVEAAEALEPRHAHTHFKFLETDGALGVINAVLLRRTVGEHARHPWRGRRRGRRRRFCYITRQ